MSDKKRLSKADVLGAPDLQTEDVDVPEWGGIVTVRGAMANEWDEYQGGLVVTTYSDDGRPTHKDNTQNSKARLLVKLVQDGEGKRMFADTDAPALGRKCQAPVNRVFQVALRLSGQTKAARKEIEGNSDAGQKNDSPTPSPAT